MFDLGFWELMLIGVIALLVVGPERLPGLARTAGLWVGKLRRFVHSVKQEVSEELAVEELQKTLAKQAAIPELEEIIEESRSMVEDIGAGLEGGEGKAGQSDNDQTTQPASKKDPDHGTV